MSEKISLDSSEMKTLIGIFTKICLLSIFVQGGGIS